MPELTQEQILQDCFIAHLAGKNTLDIRSRLIEQCNEQSAKVLYQRILISDRAQDPVLKALSLFVEADKLTVFLDNNHNLYDLLTALSKSGNHHIRAYLELIHEISPPPRWALISLIGAFFSGAIAVLWTERPDIFIAIGAWFQRTFPLLVKWLQATFSLLTNLTLVGIISNGLQLVWDWYRTFNRPYISDQKWMNLLFKTLATALTMTAYLVCTLSAGVMTPLAAALFFFSSSVSIIESIFLWWRPARLKDHEKYFGFDFVSCTDFPTDENCETNQIYFKLSPHGVDYAVLSRVDNVNMVRKGNISQTQMPEFDPLKLLKILDSQGHLKKSWSMRANYLISENYALRTQQAAKRKFVFALLTTVAIGIWYAYPPSLLMTMSCMCFTWLTAAAKGFTVDSVYKQSAQVLQKNLREIDVPLPLKLCSHEDRLFYHRFQKQLSDFSVNQTLTHVAIQCRNRLHEKKVRKTEQLFQAREIELGKKEEQLRNYESGFMRALSIFKDKTAIDVRSDVDSANEYEHGHEHELAQNKG